MYSEIATLAMEPAHRLIVIGDLGNFDSIQTRRRIEQRQRAAVSELLALNRAAELRRFESKHAHVAIARRYAQSCTTLVTS